MPGYEVDELPGISVHKAAHYAHADETDYKASECPMRTTYIKGKTFHIENGTSGLLIFHLLPAFGQI